jgi:hypothetical protein
MLKRRTTEVPAPAPARKRLRRLCDKPAVNASAEDEVATPVSDEEIEALFTSSRKWSGAKEAEEAAIALAIRSRKAGFKRDPRIMTGDVRSSAYTGHHAPILIFELMRRSKADTLSAALLEWVAQEEFGILGWSCGPTTTKMATNLRTRSSLGLGGCLLEPRVLHPNANANAKGIARPHQVIVDDGSDWIAGQCTCLRHDIRDRYRVINRFTGDIITLGSTCIESFGDAFTARAYYTRREAFHRIRRDVVVGRRWCR